MYFCKALSQVTKIKNSSSSSHTQTEYVNRYVGDALSLSHKQQIGKAYDTVKEKIS